MHLSLRREDIYIPMKVLQEIDNHKKRQDSVGANARSIIREFDSLRERGSLQEGVSLGEGRGVLRVKRVDVSEIPPDFSANDADHVIMTTAIQLEKEFPEKKVTIVSRDINMRVMTDSLGIPSEDYIENKVITFQSDLYTGFKNVEVEDFEIDAIYQDGKLPVAEEEVSENNFQTNDSVLLSSVTNTKSQHFVDIEMETIAGSETSVKKEFGE